MAMRAVMMTHRAADHNDPNRLSGQSMTRSNDANHTVKAHARPTGGPRRRGQTLTNPRPRWAEEVSSEGMGEFAPEAVPCFRRPQSGGADDETPQEVPP